MRSAAPVLSRRVRRRTETKDKLFEAAISLLAERPYEQVTIEMITERADVGKGTFFNYFENKEAVIVYFFESQFERAEEAIGYGSHPATWDQIVQIIHMLAERDSHSKLFVRTLMALCLTNEQVRAAKKKLDETGSELGVRLVSGAQASGAIRADVPADRLADCIIGVYLGTLFDWANSPAETGLHEELDFRFALLREGLRGETR